LQPWQPQAALRQPSYSKPRASDPLPPALPPQVRFLYDGTIFSKAAAFERDTIRSRVRELAFLNSSATLLLRVTKTGDCADEDYSRVDAILASTRLSVTDATAAPHANVELAASQSRPPSSLGTHPALDAGAKGAGGRRKLAHTNGDVAPFLGEAGWEYVEWMNAAKQTMHQLVT
jgi:hypothetical protein